MSVQRDEGVFLSESSRRIGYLARGPRDGRPVVYLHGCPGSRGEQRLIPEAVLNRFGVRLISVDRPGYGETDPLEGDRFARVADVLALCDGLGVGSFAVLAVSSGGSYALALAARAPDRVQRVILSSAQMPYDDEAALELLQAPQRNLLPALRLGRVEALVTGFEDARTHMLADPIAALEPNMATLTERERRWFERPEVSDIIAEDIREGLRRRVDGFLDDMLAWPKPFELDVGAVHCAVRAVHGSADDWEPLANLKRVLRQLKDAQLFVLDGLNHFGPLLYPDVVLSLALSSE